MDRGVSGQEEASEQVQDVTGTAQVTQGAPRGSAGPVPTPGAAAPPHFPEQPSHWERLSDHGSTRSQSCASRTYLGSSPGVVLKEPLEAPTVPARTLQTMCHTCHCGVAMAQISPQAELWEQEK